METVVAGIDLAASPKKCSGYSVIESKNNSPFLTKIKCLNTNKSIVNEILKDGVRVVAIDSPLTKEPKMREVDRLMIKRGFRVFPPNFSWMRELSVRGWLIAEELKSLGIKVIETHPRSALVAAGVNSLQELLDLLEVRITVSNFSESVLHKDLRDSVIAAIVAYCYIRGCCDAVKASDGIIYILKKFRN